MSDLDLERVDLRSWRYAPHGTEPSAGAIRRRTRRWPTPSAEPWSTGEPAAHGEDAGARDAAADLQREDAAARGAPPVPRRPAHPAAADENVVRMAAELARSTFALARSRLERLRGER
ncbi:MAG TPA: hypothetical protein VFB61_01775 [Gemmatimonadales bacterium]|nr:hypothetical protein [Gemmatimonadales bacterium]